MKIIEDLTCRGCNADDECMEHVFCHCPALSPIQKSKLENFWPSLNLIDTVGLLKKLPAWGPLLEDVVQCDKGTVVFHSSYRNQNSHPKFDIYFFNCQFFKISLVMKGIITAFL